MTSLSDAVTDAKLLVTCGPGGVGKTTTAAALGVAAARAGRKTVVVTVDPARRLADALGLGKEATTDEPHRVDGVTNESERGELWALMLDAEQTFDRLVRDQSPSKKQADAVLNNPVYQAISGSLSGAQEYMAIERLHQLHTSGEWDLIIVDTPPSRHAIDLLEAPDRLVGFLGHPVYRALTVGQRAFARVTDAAASMFLWAVKRLAGPQIVEDTVNFFRSLANIEGGLRTRAKEVSALLRDEDTCFVVVSSPRAEAVGEAKHLLDALQAIEHQQNRVRSIHWGPRTLDLDILLYNNLVIESERLTIPHPRMRERGFVLVPLADLDAQLALPSGETVAQLLANCSQQGIVKTTFGEA